MEIGGLAPAYSKRFLHALLVPLIQPRQRIAEITADPAAAGYSALALLLLGSLYSVTLIIGYRNGFGAVTTPFLNIPAETYYKWAALFVIPFYFCTAVLFSGTARLIAILMHGQGSFEQIFAIYGLTSFLPMVLLLWLPEATLFILFPGQRALPLGGFSSLPPWADTVRQILSIGWPLAIQAMGIKQSERLSWLAGITVTLIGFLPTAAAILIFIR